MPPQSRGSPNGAPRGYTLSAHPTLAPYLDNLPSPTSTISEERTPTAKGYSRRPAPPSPTPARPRRATITDLGVGGAGADEDADSDYDPSLDDADFQSHYSVSADNSGSESESGISEPDDVPYTTSPSTSPARPLHHSISTQSLPPPPPLPLFPPFYNRPPTPLPPSPSLTSLLRPPSLLNRSTASTRPTTPDSSDIDAETPNDTEAAVAHSARRATVVSRVSPKVPTYEYYGFVLYLASSLAFLLYILWSYLPSPFLAAIGLHYYPNRWWSLAIPSFIVTLLVYIYVALLSYNVEYLTLPMESVECMVDEAANIAVLDGKGRLKRGGSKMDLRGGADNTNGGISGSGSWGRRRSGGGGGAASGGGGMSGMNGSGSGTHNQHNGQRREKLPWRSLWNEGTDAVMDIPIGGVCQVLYGEDSREPDLHPLSAA